MQAPRPVMLAILDGWGWREDPTDNAAQQACTPAFDELWASCPHAFLRTSGLDVGLPDGQMGNSEVGHLNIGAGRVVMQDLPRIDEAVADGSLRDAPALRRLVEALKRTDGACHLMGLVSLGGVHSHQDQAAALALLLTEAGAPAYIHAFADGRDTPPRSAAEHLQRLTGALPASVPIATVSGHHYALDRDKRWERVEKAYRAVAGADGPRFTDAWGAITNAYAADVSDEFIPPAVIADYTGMRHGDGLLSFNFRADRIRQLLAALLDPDFQGFARRHPVRFAAKAGMTRYSAELGVFLETLCPPIPLQRVLGEVVAGAGRTQLRVAETEKYPHVTYFLNGGEETPYPGQDQILAPSPKVATYDLMPEMSAPELTDRAVEAIRSARYDLIVLNFANPDMVAHTGSLPAAVKAVETVDEGHGCIAAAVQAAAGALLVTADHGNCELMRAPETGDPHTAHTTNLVPVLLAGGGPITLSVGRLADVAPTLLVLMGLPQPAEMNGASLIRPHGERTTEAGQAALPDQT